MRFLTLFFSFKGRISRSEYWFGMLLCLLIMWQCLMLPKWLFADASVPILAFILGGACVVLFFIFLAALFAVWVKRLHDMGWSGWWSVPALLIPFVNLIIGFFVLGFIPGAEENNAYGEDPLLSDHRLIGEGLLYRIKKPTEE